MLGPPDNVTEHHIPGTHVMIASGNSITGGRWCSSTTIYYDATVSMEVMEADPGSAISLIVEELRCSDHPPYTVRTAKGDPDFNQVLDFALKNV